MVELVLISIVMLLLAIIGYLLYRNYVKNHKKNLADLEE